MSCYYLLLACFFHKGGCSLIVLRIQLFPGFLVLIVTFYVEIVYTHDVVRQPEIEFSNNMCAHTIHVEISICYCDGHNMVY